MKKILFVIPSLQFWGWAEGTIANLAQDFIQRGYDVTLLVFYDFPGDEYEYSGRRISLREKNFHGIFIKIFKLFSRVFKIFKIYKNEKFDVVVSFMEDANFPVILAKLVFRGSQRCFVAVRHSIHEYSWSIYEKWIRFLYPFADKIIVLTQYEKDNLINNFNILNKIICIIHNSVDTESIIKKWEEKVPFSMWKRLWESKFIFITIGRLSQIKNQSLLIEAYIDFEKKNQDSLLVILGDGPLRINLEKEAENSNILFLWNQKNIYPYLKQSSCFILTSFSEAFPNVILQAMAMRLPILSTDTQGSREILGENKYGILTPNGDKKALLKEMETIFSNTIVHEYLAKKSLERVKIFSKDSNFKKWEDILL